MQKVYNALNNASPIRYRTLSTDAYAAALHVAPEVLVSKVVARMLGRPGASVIDLTATHSLSIPFIGGLGVWIGSKFHPRLDGAIQDQFQAGAAGVPAVMLAQYIWGIFKGQGLLHGGFDMKTFLSMAVSKIITRPLMSYTNKFLPKEAIKAYDALQHRFDKQGIQSVLAGYDRNATPGADKAALENPKLGKQ